MIAEGPLGGAPAPEPMEIDVLLRAGVLRELVPGYARVAAPTGGEAGG